MSSAEYNRPIVERFFEVLDALLAMNKIKSIRSFCDTNGIDRRNLELLRKKQRKKFISSLLAHSTYGIWSKCKMATYGKRENI